LRKKLELELEDTWKLKASSNKTNLV